MPRLAAILQIPHAIPDHIPTLCGIVTKVHTIYHSAFTAKIPSSNIKPDESG